MKKAFIFLALMLGLFSSHKAHAQIGPFCNGANSSLVTYRNEVPYVTGNVVIYYGVSYQAVQASTGQHPCVTPGGTNSAYWTTVIGSSASPPGIATNTIYNAGSGALGANPFENYDTVNQVSCLGLTLVDCAVFETHYGGDAGDVIIGGESGGYPSFIAADGQTGDSGNFIRYFWSNGTIASPTAVGPTQSTVWYGYDGSNYIGQITQSVQPNGAITAGHTPGFWQVSGQTQTIFQDFWADSSQVYNGIFVGVTDSGHASGSLLEKIEYNTAVKRSLDINGNQVLAGNSTVNGTQSVTGGTTTSGSSTATSILSSATLGSELTTNGGFTTSLTGWTDSGSHWSAAVPGATHSTGAADTLSQAITVTNGAVYQVSFTFTASAGSFGIAIGGVSIYLDGATTAFSTGGTYSRSFVASASGTLVITPTSSFAGTITSISVKSVTLNSVVPALIANNSDGSQGVPFYAGGVAADDVFIGSVVGTSSTVSATKDVGVGYQAFQQNITGTNDVAIGYQSLNANTDGYQNTAVGGSALADNTTGAGNTALGFDALATNTQGTDNNAFGEFALWLSTTGSNNSAFGQGALEVNTTGFSNAAFGQSALAANTTGTENTAVGVEALQTDVTGTANTAVGILSGLLVTTGIQDTFIGFQSGLASSTQHSFSSCLGENCQVSADHQVVLGDSTTTQTVTNGINMPAVIYVVTTLPVCSSTYLGGSAVVSDATSPTYLGTYTGGGSGHPTTPVICNGTNWITY